MTANQSGACLLGNPPEERTVAATAGTYTVNMALTGTITGLTATSSASWLTIPYSISATSLVFSTTANPNVDTRSAAITVTNSCGRSISFRVTQSTNRGILIFSQNSIQTGQICVQSLKVYSSSYTLHSYFCSSSCISSFTGCLTFPGGYGDMIYWTEVPAGVYTIEYSMFTYAAGVNNPKIGTLTGTVTGGNSTTVKVSLG